MLLPLALALPFLRGQILLFRDILHFAIPAQAFSAQALAHGRLPQWTPLLYGGAPFLAEPGSGVFYPPNWIFLWLDPGRAATAFVLLHGPIAALGMLLLARTSGLSRGAAALAATSYTASGYLLSMHGGHYYFASAALLPLCTALLVRCARARQGRPRALVLGALPILLLVLNGEVQALALSVLLAAALVLDLPPLEPSPHEAPRRTGADLLLSAGFVAGALALGLALAAVQLVPSTLFVRGTVRAHGVSLADAALWSLHPLRFIELLVPQPFGLPWPDNGYWGPLSSPGAHHLPWALSLWLGPSALLLAPVALLGKGRVRALFGVAALGLLLSLGTRTPLFALWVRAVPFMDKLRYPEKYALLASAALVLLGARGLDVAREVPRGRKFALALFAAASFFLLVAAALALRAPPRLVEQIRQGLASSQANLSVADALAAFVRHLAQAGALALALALALQLSRDRPALLAPLFVAVGCVAGAAFALAQLSYGDGNFLRTPPPLLDEIHAATPAGSTGRVFNLGNCSFRGGGEGTLIERVRHFEWASGKENFLTLFGVRDTLGYGAAESSAQVEWFRALLQAGAAGSAPITAARALGASVVVGCDSLERPRARPIAGALPRVRYAQPRQPPPTIAALAHAVLASPPGIAWVHVEESAGPPVRGTNAGSAAAQPFAGSAVILEDEPERIRIRADGPGGVVVLADSFADGWSATVDRNAAPVLRADGNFRAVALSAGAHEVMFSYRTPGLRAGALVSALAALVGAVLLLWRRARR